MNREVIFMINKFIYLKKSYRTHIKVIFLNKIIWDLATMIAKLKIINKSRSFLKIQKVLRNRKSEIKFLIINKILKQINLRIRQKSNWTDLAKLKMKRYPLINYFSLTRTVCFKIDSRKWPINQIEINFVKIIKIIQ